MAKYFTAEVYRNVPSGEKTALGADIGNWELSYTTRGFFTRNSKSDSSLNDRELTILDRRLLTRASDKHFNKNDIIKLNIGEQFRIIKVLRPYQWTVLYLQAYGSEQNAI